MQISSALIPHASGNGLFLMESHSFPREKGQLFCTDMDETLSLVCTKIELLRLKHLHLKDKGKRLKLSGLEHFYFFLKGSVVKPSVIFRFISKP